MNEQIYVQYGCGLTGLTPKEWRHFDASPTLFFERIPLIGKLYTRNDSRFADNVEFGDIVKGLPITEKSCKGVYCCHVLEHLALEDFRVALRNTYKILHPGGVFRFVLPDLEYSVKKYQENTSDDAALKFIGGNFLGRKSRPKNLKDFIFSSLSNIHHLWMWDYKSMQAELCEVGFKDIRRAYFGDSSDPMFQQVEQKGRWYNSLGVECKKPN